MPTISDRLDIPQDFTTGDRIQSTWGNQVVDNLELNAVLFDWFGEGIFLPTEFNAVAAGDFDATISDGRAIIGAYGDLVLRWRKNIWNATVPPNTTSYVYITRDYEEANPREPLLIVRSLSTDAGAATPGAGTHQLCRLVSNATTITTFDNLPPARINLPGLGSATMTGAANLVTGQVSIAATATQAVIARATRQAVTLKNTHATVSAFVGPATVTVANGIELKAGESLTLTFVGIIQAIAASGTVTLHFADEYA